MIILLLYRGVGGGCCTASAVHTCTLHPSNCPRYIIVVSISISILCIDLYVAYLAISMIFYLHNRVSPIQCNGTPPFHRAAQWRISRFVRLEKFWVGCFLYIGSTVRVCGHPKWSKWRLVFWHVFSQIGWHWTKIEQPGGYEGWWTCCSTRNSDWSGIMSSDIISMTLEWSCWGEDVCVSITLCNNKCIYVYTVYVMQKHLMSILYIYIVYMYIYFLNKYQSVLASWSKPLPDPKGIAKIQ